MENPIFLMDDLGENPTIFGKTSIKTFVAPGSTILIYKG